MHLLLKDCKEAHQMIEKVADSDNLHCLLLWWLIIVSCISPPLQRMLVPRRSAFEAYLTISQGDSSVP